MPNENLKVRLLLIRASHPRCHLLLDVQRVVDHEETASLERCLLCLCRAAIDHSSLCHLVLWQKYPHGLEKWSLSSVAKDCNVVWKRSWMCWGDEQIKHRRIPQGIGCGFCPLGPYLFTTSGVAKWDGLIIFSVSIQPLVWSVLRVHQMTYLPN